MVGSAFDNAAIGIAVLTPAGIVILCNAALGALLGRSPSDLVGAPFFKLTHLDDIAAARLACEWLRSDGSRVSRLECQFLRRDGTAVWVAVNTAWVPDTLGHPAHVIMHAEDITERKALEETLTHRALHDALTGLPNRVLLAERITHACAGRGRHSRPSCLFYVDLNGFKAVNDRFGHTTGDRVLQQLAERFAALLRPEDTAARLGGDEFAVLCVDMEPRYGAQVAERLRAAAAEPFVIDGHTISVTAAVGVSTSEAVDPAAPDAAAMLHEADRAMYEQNSGGRKTADGRHNWRRGRHCPAGRVGAPRREPDAWLMALCPEHHERITIAFRAARRRLFFRTSSFDVTWREVHAICKERNPKYQPKPNSLWRMAWELIRV